MTTAKLSEFPRRHYSEGVGMFSICCAHLPCLEAALTVARHDGTDLLVEATSNQVDQFGGYTGLTPQAFRAWVIGLAKEQGLDEERLILGGDHLGPNPWRRENADAAMAKARTLVQQYAGAGFSKLHLDCSMALGDDAGATPPPEVSADRAADLCRVAEDAAAAADFPPPFYVIGTEVPIPGGATHDLDAEPKPTRVGDAEATLTIHRRAFLRAGLEAAWSRVIALVVQPGVEFGNYTVADYHREPARGLSEFIAGHPELVFEAHSTDYQTAGALDALVEDHFAILKVGPWLTFAYREALFALEAIAAEMGAPVGLRETLEQVMLEEPKYWRGHYHGDENSLRRARAYSYSDRLRYYWPNRRIQEAVGRLLHNPVLSGMPLPLLEQYMPEQYQAVRAGRLECEASSLVRHAVETVLRMYARATRQPNQEGE